MGSFSQSNFPLSTIIPPIELPCPPINLVSECITIAAPCSMGLQITGADVLSIIRGILYSFPISEISFIGKTLSLGFGKLSP